MSYSAIPPYEVTTIVVRASARQLHREASELRGERDVRAEHLEVLGADRRDVHRVRDEPALERGRDLLGDDDACTVLRLARRRREMRRDDDVVQLEQRACVRLGREHVERRACDLAAPQRLQQRVLVDELAAGGVDEAHAVAHARECVRVDRPARLVRQRQVEREELRSAVDLLRRLEAIDPELAEPLRAHVRVVRDDAHAEAERTARDLLADAPEAEHADRLAGELDAAVRLPLPASLLERGVRLRDVPGKRDEEPDRCAPRRRRPSTPARWRR